MFHDPIRFSADPSPDLSVPFATFESALALFKNCERTALRAYTQSEARRMANKLIRPREMPGSFANIVALFADADAVGHAALRQKRFDFAAMLIRSDKFERQVAERLIREGRISEGVLP